MNPELEHLINNTMQQDPLARPVILDELAIGIDVKIVKLFDSLTFETRKRLSLELTIDQVMPSYRAVTSVLRIKDY